MANYISRHTGEEFDNSIENFAEEYSTSKSYVIDNLVVYEGKLYKCITATSGTWNASKWEEKKVAELLKDSGKVKTVNNIEPDSGGNITINIPQGTITGINVDGTSVATSGTASINTPIGYYTCTTAAATVAKEGTYVRGAKYSSGNLPTGAIALVKFTNNNTAANPTLNLNGSGAKALMQYGTTRISTTSTTTGWQAGSVCLFVYDGTNWVRNQGYNTVNTYVNRDAEEGGTSTSLVTTGEKYIWNNKSDFSGSYNDLTNKPTIPTVGNGALTVKAGTTASGTFTANQSGASTITIDATTHKELSDAISAIPTPMQFKGTLGTNGTITSLPTAGSDNKGFTYKVITAGTYASQAAKVGDVFVSDGSSWVLIPSGDEPSGTVTNVATGTGLTGGPITTSGTIAVDTSVIATKAYTDSVIPIGYYTCDTSASTAAKVGTYVSGAKYTSSYLPTGAMAMVRFVNTNSVSAPTLNLNSSGAKPAMQYGTTAISTSAATSSWQAGAVCLFTYDGTNWVRNQGYNTNSDSVPSAICATAAETAAKTAACTYYVATPNSYLHVSIRYANTSASAITMNVNSIGAKPIYINGAASSTSNYTLPAGTYIVYYDGTNYYFRTDGVLPTGGISVGNKTGDSVQLVYDTTNKCLNFNFV